MHPTVKTFNKGNRPSDGDVGGTITTGNAKTAPENDNTTTEASSAGGLAEEGEQNFELGHDSEAAGHDMSEEQRITMLRKRNAVYSKRKYYKKKKEVSELEATKFELESENQRLKKENMRLEALLMDANLKVAAMRNYPGDYAMMRGGVSSMFQSSGFPTSAAMIGSACFGGSALFPLGSGPLSGMVTDPYMLQQEAYQDLIRHDMLQQERMLYRPLTGMLHSRDMPFFNPLYLASSSPGLSTLSGQHLMSLHGDLTAANMTFPYVPPLQRPLPTERATSSTVAECSSPIDQADGQRRANRKN